MYGIVKEQISQWEQRANEIEQQLIGYDLSELKAHDLMVKELFMNLNAENAVKLKAALSSPLHNPTEMMCELSNIRLYLSREWQPERDTDKFKRITFEVKTGGYNGAIVSKV